MRAISYSQAWYLSVNLRCFLCALTYALVLSSLPIDMFVDRDNYLTYAANAGEVFNYNWNLGLVNTLTNEPLWLCINMLLGSLFSPDIVIRIIIFVSAYVIAYLLLRSEQKHFLLILLFLLLPQVIKNHIIHLRQGAAIAVFLIGWFSLRRKNRWFFFLLSPLIHASFFFIVFFYILNIAFSKVNLSAGLRSFMYTCVGVVLAVSSLWVATMVGARQGGEYNSYSQQISGLGFIFWLTFMLIFILQGRTFLKRYSFQLGLLLFYLTSYFFLPVAARVFESGLLLIFIAALQLTSWRRDAFYSMYIFYFCVQWLPRFFSPGFGWGIENYS